MIHAGTGSYLSLGWGAGLGGGVVERETEHPLWLPYVHVGDVDEATGRAQELGASVRLEPREGPAGWRSILTVPAGAEIALWQSKR
jgi:predicted enzyme related to lactoylglutathione lyase